MHNTRIIGRALGTTADTFKLQILIVFFVLSGVGQANAHEAAGALHQTSEVKKVVVLHNASNVGLWRNQVNAGLQEAFTFENESGLTIRSTVEYTSLDLMTPGEEPRVLVEALKYKQRLDPADLVISVLDDSSLFMEQYRDEIYPGLPHLRFTPSYVSGSDFGFDLEPGDAVLYSNFQETVIATLELIPSVLPEVETIYLIAGGSAFGQGLQFYVQAYVSDQGFPINVEVLPARDREQLFQSAQELPPNSALYMLSYEQDFDGHAYSTPDLVSRLAPEANAPIFAFYDSLAGRGILGGRMTTADDTGRILGDMAISMLSGEELSPRGMTAATIFDDRQIRRWNIDTDLIPGGSLIDYQVPNMWENYRQQILWGIAIILLQASLIAALIYSLKRRRLVEVALIDKADALGLQKDLFESVIDSVPEALLVSDTGGNIFAANESVKDVFHCNSNELVGKQIASVLSDPELQPLVQSPGKVDGDTRFEPITATIQRKDSSAFTGEVLGTHIMSSQGEMLGNIHVIRDVTHRLAREAETQQNQKMEALGALVGGISHDFNNVLGVISGYTELLHLGAKQDKDKEKLDKILKATRRGSALCKQVMTFSRDMSVEKKDLCLADVVNESMKLLSVSIPQDISVSSEEDTAKTSIFGNFTQIEQLLINLVTNASQAMGNKSGNIDIHITQRHISESRALARGTLEPGVYVELKVSDNGCGMSQETQERIFEPFFTTKAEEKGQGMGMAIVYRIVKGHNAVIDVKSVEGAGTTVTVSFPCSETAEVGSEESGETMAVHGTGQRILLVDDEEELLESMQQLLSNIGYKVDAYSDPQAALRQFSESPGDYDLLISDHRMPAMSGSELTRSLRELQANLPAILCTGYSEVLDVSAQGDAQFDAIMQKPFTINDISATVQQILKRHQAQELAEELPA